jgi:hypothetical protein
MLDLESRPAKIENTGLCKLRSVYWTEVHSLCSQALANVRFGSKADMCCAKRHVRFTPESGHWPYKRKDRLATVSPKSDQVFCSGGDCSGVLPLPAPTEQTQRAEAACEKRKCGG